MTPKVKALKRRQRAFVMHLAADPQRNATKAARKAGYSPKSAHTTAHRLLKYEHIQDALDELSAELWDSMIATASETAAILTKITRQNLADYTDKDGNVDLEGIKRDGVILSSIETDKDGKVKVKAEGIKGAADSLAKLRGWNEPDRIDVRSTGAPKAPPNLRFAKKSNAEPDERPEEKEA